AQFPDPRLWHSVFRFCTNDWLSSSSGSKDSCSTLVATALTGSHAACGTFGVNRSDISAHRRASSPQALGGNFAINCSETGGADELILSPSRSSGRGRRPAVDGRKVR